MTVTVRYSVKGVTMNGRERDITYVSVHEGFSFLLDLTPPRSTRGSTSSSPWHRCTSPCSSSTGRSSTRRPTQRRRPAGLRYLHWPVGAGDGDMDVGHVVLDLHHTIRMGPGRAACGGVYRANPSFPAQSKSITLISRSPLSSLGPTAPDA